MQKQKIKQSHKLFVRDEMKRVGGQPGFISVEKEKKKITSKHEHEQKEANKKSKRFVFLSLYFQKSGMFSLEYHDVQLV